ncbi:putative alcohol dehydrogenase [Anopheles sinensis]|uniref:Putative alcohol dehydrogenase n=1 Tax=Anopheles sinensis TaxID=74873 RepID=A0A084VPL6_ANOSI|nr:putative alcohol dehydrogenase [Anopheles sinensis]
MSDRGPVLLKKVMRTPKIIPTGVYFSASWSCANELVKMPYLPGRDQKGTSAGGVRNQNDHPTARASFFSRLLDRAYP